MAARSGSSEPRILVVERRCMVGCKPVKGAHLSHCLDAAYTPRYFKNIRMGYSLVTGFSLDKEAHALAPLTACRT
jgi:hypothetical protein